MPPYRAATDLATAGGSAAMAAGVSLDLISIVSHSYTVTMAVLALILAVGRVALMIREWRGESLPMTPEQIIEEIIRREGGFVDHPSDRGGPTNWGITIKTLSEWRGAQQTAADVRALTREEAARIYMAEYVTRPRFGEIADADLRELVIDTGVNHGRVRTGRWLQETLNRNFGARLKVDGVVGDLTLAAVNVAPARALCARMLIRRLQGFADFVQANPSQIVFLEGWVVRAGHFALKLV